MAACRANFDAETDKINIRHRDFGIVRLPMARRPHSQSRQTPLARALHSSQPPLAPAAPCAGGRGEEEHPLRPARERVLRRNGRPCEGRALPGGPRAVLGAPRRAASGGEAARLGDGRQRLRLRPRRGADTALFYVASRRAAAGAAVQPVRVWAERHAAHGRGDGVVRPRRARFSSSGSPLVACSGPAPAAGTQTAPRERRRSSSRSKTCTRASGASASYPGPTRSTRRTRRGAAASWCAAGRRGRSGRRCFSLGSGVRAREAAPEEDICPGRRTGRR